MILKFGKPVGITPSEKGVKVVFFVGPTGVGKTTTIAKIASRFQVDDKKKVALLTADTYRIAAAEQLRTYANILEVPLTFSISSMICPAYTSSTSFSSMVEWSSFINLSRGSGAASYVCQYSGSAFPDRLCDRGD